MRDSPPEEARAFAGPEAPSSRTRWPALRRCQAVQAPNTPAPTTRASHGWLTVSTEAARRLRGAAAVRRAAANDAARAPAERWIQSRRVNRLPLFPTCPPG